MSPLFVALNFVYKRALFVICRSTDGAQRAKFGRGRWSPENRSAQDLNAAAARTSCSRQAGARARLRQRAAGLQLGLPGPGHAGAIGVRLIKREVTFEGS